MDISDLGWERKPQEYDTGDYWFDGQFFVTKQVMEHLSKLEITMIYADARNLAETKKGIDYLLVYNHKEKGKLFFIDQVTKKSLKDGDQPIEHNYCTLLFAEEY